MGEGANRVRTDMGKNDETAESQRRQAPQNGSICDIATKALARGIVNRHPTPDDSVAAAPPTPHRPQGSTRASAVLLAKLMNQEQRGTLAQGRFGGVMRVLLCGPVIVSARRQTFADLAVTHGEHDE